MRVSSSSALLALSALLSGSAHAAHAPFSVELPTGPASASSSVMTSSSTTDGGGQVGRGWATQFVLGKLLAMNESTIERVMDTRPSARRAHVAHAVDLTDENWQHVLRDGGAEGTTWVIGAYGRDPISQSFMDAFEQVVSENSSAAGGQLGESYRFARLHYEETVPSTMWWLWRLPAMIITTDGGEAIRTLTTRDVAPDAHFMSQFLMHEYWQRKPVWDGLLSASGALGPVMPGLAYAWKRYYDLTAQIPSFVMLIISGMLMNVTSFWFFRSKSSGSAAAASATPGQAAQGQPRMSMDPAERQKLRDELRAKLNQQRGKKPVNLERGTAEGDRRQQQAK